MNTDKNPFPNDIPKKSPPQKEKGTVWKWELENSIPNNVNESSWNQFDDFWRDERAYDGKHLEHKYPHVSIYDREAELFAAQPGFVYRIFNCKIKEFVIIGTCLIYMKNCKIQKITGVAHNKNLIKDDNAPLVPETEYLPDPEQEEPEQEEPEQEEPEDQSGISEKDIKDMIKRHEGLRLNQYNDSLGYPTIGYGHLVTPGENIPKSITQEEADALFDKDYEEHKEAAEKIPGYENMNASGQAALIDLTFNMGPTWYKKWPNLCKQLQSGNCSGAADNLRNSTYASQVKGRAVEISNMIENGCKDNPNPPPPIPKPKPKPDPTPPPPPPPRVPLVSDSKSKPKVYFVDCKIGWVVGCGNYFMVFEGQTKFDEELALENKKDDPDIKINSHFENITRCVIQIRSKPPWSNIEIGQFRNIECSELYISGPVEIHRDVNEIPIHEYLISSDIINVNQWFCTDIRSGCNRPPKPDRRTIYKNTKFCYILNLGVSINNPEWCVGMHEKIEKCKIINLGCSYEVHAIFYLGEEVEKRIKYDDKNLYMHKEIDNVILSIDSRLFNCDIMHYHVRESRIVSIKCNYGGNPGGESIIPKGFTKNVLISVDDIYDMNDEYYVFEAEECFFHFVDCFLINKKPFEFFHDTKCYLRFQNTELIVLEKHLATWKDCSIRGFRCYDFNSPIDKGIELENCKFEWIEGKIKTKLECINSKKSDIVIRGGDIKTFAGKDILESETKEGIKTKEGSLSLTNLKIKSELECVKSNETTSKQFNCELESKGNKTISFESSNIYLEKVKSSNDISINSGNCILIKTDSKTKILANGCNEANFNESSCKDSCQIDSKITKIINSSFGSLDVKGGIILSAGNKGKSSSYSSSIGFSGKDDFSSLEVDGLYGVVDLSSGGFSGNGIILYDKTSMQLSTPAKRGFYITDDADLYLTGTLNITALNEIICKSTSTTTIIGSEIQLNPPQSV